MFGKTFNDDQDNNSSQKKYWRGSSCVRFKTFIPYLISYDEIKLISIYLIYKKRTNALHYCLAVYHWARQTTFYVSHLGTVCSISMQLSIFIYYTECICSHLLPINHVFNQEHFLYDVLKIIRKIFDSAYDFEWNVEIVLSMRISKSLTTNFVQISL